MEVENELQKRDGKENVSIVSDILNVVTLHRQRTYRKINEEMINMYFEIGKYLSERVKANKWGSKILEQIAEQIKKVQPTLKGFTRLGLYRMIRFYETYRYNVIVSPMVEQISWSNNIIILEGTKTMEEKEFYIRLCIKNNYTKRELQRQIKSHYYERYLLSGGNALISTEKLIDEDDYPNTRILDINTLEFLDLPLAYKEKDLRDSIVENLKDFILEIGKDFTFMGKEYRITVGNNDYYIDLLFYNRTANCLVAFELKIDEFKPEYLSKMNFYLEALDRQEKKEDENPSIGVILCADKDNVVVEYAMARNTSPIIVSQYTTKIIDKKLLENKLIELKNLLM